MARTDFGGERFGDYNYLTFMAENAPKGAPKQIFWEMDAQQTGDFDKVLDEYVQTLGLTDDPLADYPDLEEDEGGEVVDLLIPDLEEDEGGEVADLLIPDLEEDEGGEVADLSDLEDKYWWGYEGDDEWDDVPVGVTALPEVAPEEPQLEDFLGLEDDPPEDDPDGWVKGDGAGDDAGGGGDGGVAEWVDTVLAGTGDGAGDDAGGGDGGAVVTDPSAALWHEIAQTLNALGPDINKILDYMKQANLTVDDILAGTEDPSWEGTSEFRATLAEEMKALLLSSTSAPSGVTGGAALDLLPRGPDSYVTATANLRTVFYPTIYQQEGVGAATQEELESLLEHTRLLFFLENGQTAWEDLGEYPHQRAAYEEGEIEDRPTLEKNYEKWLGGYLERPFAQRLNADEGPDFYSLMRDVSLILKTPPASVEQGLGFADLLPAEEARWQRLEDKRVWVEGLFGGTQAQNDRDTLVKLGLTHGGMGYYSRQIHKAAQAQMDYYRNIGWSEARIFDQMTKGMKKPQAAAPVVPSQELASYEE